MKPLRVVAELDPLGGPLSLSEGYIHLDGLLAYWVATLAGMPVPYRIEDLSPIDVPIEWEPAHRFHLASASVSEWETLERRYVQRRFPVQEAALLTTMKSVHIGAGATKHFRVPIEAGRVIDDRMVWYAIGDRLEIERLLSHCTHLGRRRGVGLGRVKLWTVEPCETWDGFPVLSPDGKPLRHLPLDWPGLTDPQQRYGVLTYYGHFGYHDLSAEQLIAAP